MATCAGAPQRQARPLSVSGRGHEAMAARMLMQPDDYAAVLPRPRLRSSDRATCDSSRFDLHGSAVPLTAASCRRTTAIPSSHLGVRRDRCATAACLWLAWHASTASVADADDGRRAPRAGDFTRPWPFEGTAMPHCVSKTTVCIRAHAGHQSAGLGVLARTLAPVDAGGGPSTTCGRDDGRSREAAGQDSSDSDGAPSSTPAPTIRDLPSSESCTTLGERTR